MLLSPERHVECGGDGAGEPGFASLALLSYNPVLNRLQVFNPSTPRTPQAHNFPQLKLWQGGAQSDLLPYEGVGMRIDLRREPNGDEVGIAEDG